MKKLHLSIRINASVEKVWEVMLDDATYRRWAEPFYPGTYYKGSWKTGSRMLFLAPSPEGDSGMISEIVENRKFEFISIHHIGLIENGVENTSPEVVKDWGDAMENYTFRRHSGGTELIIDCDTSDEHYDMINEMWIKALENLKALSESS
jgi:uncharacterized protein YndB with AHSA1/START domain